MKMYVIAYHDSFDEQSEWHLQRKVWSSRDVAQSEADDWEREGSDFQTICTVIEMEVVE